MFSELKLACYNAVVLILALMFPVLSLVCLAFVVYHVGAKLNARWGAKVKAGVSQLSA